MGGGRGKTDAYSRFRRRRRAAGGGIRGGPSFAYSLPVHAVHARRDRVASLTTCRLHGAAIQSASPLGPGRALTSPCGWNKRRTSRTRSTCRAMQIHSPTVSRPTAAPTLNAIARTLLTEPLRTSRNNPSLHTVWPVAVGGWRIRCRSATAARPRCRPAIEAPGGCTSRSTHPTTAAAIANMAAAARSRLAIGIPIRDTPSARPDKRLAAARGSDDLLRG